MLAHYDIAARNVRLEAFVDLNAPGSLFKGCRVALTLLHRCCVLPACNEASFVLLVKAVEDRNAVFACGPYEDLQVLDRVCVLEALRNEAIELAGRMKEVVVWIDKNDSRVRE